MANIAFVNLAVKDLEASMKFFKALGYDHNPDFTDENATCVMFNDGFGVMLLVESFFDTFTTRKTADTATTVEALLALSLDSREQVDKIAEAALAAGATATDEPKDMGFMYGRDFTDLDGHQWSVFHMDMAAAPQE